MQLIEVRDAKVEQYKEITKLLQAYDKAVIGYPETDEDEIKGLLESVEDGNAICLQNSSSEIIGFAVVTGNGPVFPSLLVVHPEWQNQGFETLLFEGLDARMQGRAGRLNETCTVTVSANNEYEEGQFSKHGFKSVRYWWEMGITIGDNKPAYSFDSLSVRNIVVGEDDVKVHQAFEEVFQDHFDYHPSSLKEFQERYKRTAFNSELWYLLMDGDEVAGFAFCKELPDEGQAEITHVGMRRNWRGKGLAKNLLKFSFSELANKGRNQISLSVDANSLTEATKVYSSVGMKVNRSFVRYDKTFK